MSRASVVTREDAERLLFRQMDSSSRMEAVEAEATLIKHLGIFDESESWRPGWMSISMEIASSSSSNFDRRLKIADLASIHEHKYSFQFNAASTDVVIPALSHLVGQRIRRVEMYKCGDRSILAAVTRLLAGTQISILRISLRTISGDALNHLLCAVEAHKVEHLSLYAECITPNPLGVILILSTHVRSMTLHQILLPKERKMERTANFLFGQADTDWAIAILHMFRGKLDKLLIENFWYLGYLSKDNADTLRTLLPALGRKVWLSVTCDKYPERPSDYTTNDHSIQFYNYSTPAFLRIIHTSREEEQSETVQIQ